MNPQQAVVEQYKTSANLEARINLHEHYRTNPYGWHRWAFDQFDLPERARILELGCGDGTLWLKNQDRIPGTWEVTLSDFSEGMLEQAQRNLTAIERPFNFQVIDVIDIPFSAERFDAVIANHMLYYVEDKPRGFSEMQRVLRPDGRLYATTIGKGHMQELWELVQAFDSSLPLPTLTELSFTLENGPAQLARWFSAVELRRYQDGLVVTDARALINYMLSSATLANLSDPSKAELAQFVQERCASQGGVFKIAKDSGMICARRG